MAPSWCIHSHVNGCISYFLEQITPQSIFKHLTHVKNLVLTVKVIDEGDILIRASPLSNQDHPAHSRLIVISFLFN